MGCRRASRQGTQFIAPLCEPVIQRGGELGPSDDLRRSARGAMIVYYADCPTSACPAQLEDIAVAVFDANLAFRHVAGIGNP